MPAFPCQQDFYCIVVVFSCVTGVLNLRLVSLNVPTAVMQGEAIWLNCTLDLESDELYSVKWYKNDVEFYRYLPRDSPSGQKYDLPGVYVDLVKSKQGHVYLYKTDISTEGMYRCEASAESPTFQTVEGEKEVMVYVPPQGGPIIQGIQPRYVDGDIVNVSCKSSPSKPGATMKWYLNGKELSPDLYISYPKVDHPNGLQTSVVGLTFVVSHDHLLEGAIVLRCTAIVYQIFFLTSEELVIGESMSETSSISDARRDGPRISGGKDHYRLGDIVDVNCSSSKSIQPTELHWYINDEPAKRENLIKYPKMNHPDGRNTSILGLRFIVDEKHFGESEDMMRLKCTETLSKAVSVKSDEKIVGDNHKRSGFHVAENAGRVTSPNGSTNLHSQVLCFFLFILTALFHI